MPDPTPQPPPLRVLVVDADARTRESLSGLLGIGRRCVVVGSAGTDTEALELAERLRPDVVVLDPRLPDVDRGMALIGRLRLLLPDVRIALMGSSDALEPALRAAGVDACIRKTFRATELVHAVVSAARAVPAGVPAPAERAAS